jgi:hypothetical protein
MIMAAVVLSRPLPALTAVVLSRPLPALTYLNYEKELLK